MKGERIIRTISETLKNVFVLDQILCARVGLTHLYAGWGTFALGGDEGCGEETGRGSGVVAGSFLRFDFFRFIILG